MQPIIQCQTIASSSSILPDMRYVQSLVLMLRLFESNLAISQVPLVY